MGLLAYLAIVVGLVAALWKHPAVALAGVLCMFGLEQWGQATHPFFAQHQTFTNYLVGGVLLLALSVKFIKRDAALANYPPVGWLVLSFFLYAFASTIWAPHPDVSLNIWMSRSPYVLTIIVLTPLVISSTRDLQIALKALVVVGTFLTVLLLVFVSWESRAIVTEGGYGNPLAVSEMAGMVALVTILGNPWDSSKSWQIIRWAGATLCLFLVVRSGSRGQLIGLIALTALCWPIARRMTSFKQLFLWGVTILFLTGITTWALQQFWGQHNAYYAGGNRWSEKAMEGAMAGRFEQAFYLTRIWFQSPDTVFFGLGNSASFDRRILGIYPHFVPLEVLTEEGLLGFGLYLMILYSTLRNAFRCFKKIDGDPKELRALGALISLFLFTLILSFKQGSLLLNLEMFMFAIILGRWNKLLSPTDKLCEVPSPPFTQGTSRVFTVEKA